jgi:hypothetical protein
MNFFGALPVAVGMSTDKDGMGTKSIRRPQRHGRMHPEFAGLVGSRRNDPALSSLAANYNSSAFQRRIKQFFHRDKEGVHVDVENGSAGGHKRCRDSITAGRGGKPIRSITSGPSTTATMLVGWAWQVNAGSAIGAIVEHDPI